MRSVTYIYRPAQVWVIASAVNWLRGIRLPRHNFQVEVVPNGASPRVRYKERGASPPSRPRDSRSCSIAFKLKAFRGDQHVVSAQLGVGKVGLPPLCFATKNSFVKSR